MHELLLRLFPITAVQTLLKSVNIWPN